MPERFAPRPSPRRRRGWSRHVGAAATLAVLVLWAVLLRPQALGGPATYVLVSGRSMEPALHTGDLVVALGGGGYSHGDVAVYPIPDGGGALVIHRIVGGDGRDGYVTKGDNRAERDPWEPTAGDLLGRAWVVVPGAGNVLLWLRSPLGLAAAAGLATTLVVALPGTSEPRRPRRVGGRRVTA